MGYLSYQLVRRISEPSTVLQGKDVVCAKNPNRSQKRLKFFAFFALPCFGSFTMAAKKEGKNKQEDAIDPLTVLKPLPNDPNLTWASYFAPEELKEELQHIAESWI